MGKTNYDNAIRANRTAIREAEQNLHAIVLQARQAGYTFDDLGRAFDVTRQAAWERWSKVIRDNDEAMERATA